MRPASLGSCLRAAAAVALCVCTGVAVVSAAAEGLRPRRLDFWNSAVQMGTQFVMYPEMEKMLEQQSLALKNILRGADTRDLKIQTYVHPESCMVVFDTIADQDNGDNMNLGLIDANSIEVVFSYGEHQGQLRYTERRQESMQFLKFATKHVQRFEVPRGCVGTANAHWVAYCQQTRGRCNVGRIEVHFSREGHEDAPTFVPRMALASFIQRRMEEEGRNYYEVLDWFETPTPPHRMIFDVERCLMHFRFSTLEPQLSTVSWLKNRQGVRVDVREVNGEIIARKTAIASGCGAMKVEDIEVAQKALEDGSYKLLVLFKPVDQHENRFNDTVTIPRERDIRPARNYDYYNEEQLDFIDYFPDHKVIPLDVMGRLRME